jgi:hypothetical protein
LGNYRTDSGGRRGGRTKASPGQGSVSKPPTGYREQGGRRQGEDADLLRHPQSLLGAAPATHASFHGEKVAYGLLVQLVLEGQPRCVLEPVLAFAAGVGLPVTLAEVGLADLPAELLQRVAARATAEGETIHNEPFEVRPDLVADAIRAADALGRDWKKAHGDGRPT